MNGVACSRTIKALLAVAAVAALAYMGLIACVKPSRAEGEADTTVAVNLPCREPHDSYFVAAFGPFDPPDGGVLLVTDTLRNDPSVHQQIAARLEVGAVYGLAHDARRHTLYAASHLRYYAAYGTGGPGTIYAIDLLTGRVDRWAKLDAGPDRWMEIPDFQVASRYIGRTDLGDIEIDENGSRLFVANLHDQRVHVLSIPDGNHLEAFDHGAAGEPWAANARIFGLGVRSDWLYHAVVDSRESTRLPGEFAAYVYRSRADGTEMELVLQFDLGYRTSCPWQPWQPAWDDRGPFPCEPILSDIEFRPDGELILGLRDRLADLGVSSRGDILPTQRLGQKWYAVVSPEHYKDGIFFPHDAQETMYGGLAAPLVADRVVAAASALPEGDPLSSGLVWFDNANGYPKGPADGRELMFNREHLGLGDIEYNCVLDTPTPTPTPSPTASPTPSATPSPTVIATTTPTVAASPSPTSARYRVYLPLALTESCEKQQVHADVALVLDMSTTMLRRTVAGQRKLDAAQAAAVEFLGYMDFSLDDGAADQVAVVGFNDTAWIQQPLSRDTPTLARSIQQLEDRVAEGTRLDLALERSLEVIDSPQRRPLNSAVLVLLTDGLPNRVPTPVPSGPQEATVVGVAEQARSLGFRVFTIGLGRPDAEDPLDRINPKLLRLVADEPSMYYETPDADTLTEIYAKIARAIDCPADQRWGRRQ